MKLKHPAGTLARPTGSRFKSSGYCVPSQGAQTAVPLPPNGSCPFGWTRSGFYCLRSGL